jgi:hypothetical protein
MAAPFFAIAGAIIAVAFIILWAGFAFLFGFSVPSAEQSRGLVMIIVSIGFLFGVFVSASN